MVLEYFHLRYLGDILQYCWCCVGVFLCWPDGFWTLGIKRFSCLTLSKYLGLQSCSTASFFRHSILDSNSYLLLVIAYKCNKACPLAQAYLPSWEPETGRSKNQSMPDPILTTFLWMNLSTFRFMIVCLVCIYMLNVPQHRCKSPRTALRSQFSLCIIWLEILYLN